MYIAYFAVQGYKSLADVELKDLAKINVLHGLNDVGKSNILQAIDLYFRLLPAALRSLAEPDYTTMFTWNDLVPYTSTIFRQPGPREITWQVRIRLPATESVLDIALTLTESSKPGGGMELSLDWLTPEPPDDVKWGLLDDPGARFSLVDAQRRLTPEWLTDETPPLEYNTGALYGPTVQPENLRYALLDANVGQDMNLRKRFRQLARLLDKNFEVGELDTALGDRRPLPRERPDERNRYGQKILIWFLRPDLPDPLPVEDVGSGVQQVLLILTQLLLNPARAAGIEEPEMNLGPEWQRQLLAVLQGLIGPNPGQFDQFFITSHSPEFEGAEHFYDVTYVDGETRVQKLPLAKRERYFAHLAQGEEMGPYLNSLNQVTLPQRVIDDLGLRRREPVFFYKAEEGYWRLRTKSEVLALMEEKDEYDVTPDATDADSPG